jgi:fumarylacetoacetase
VAIATADGRETVVSRSNAKHLYWSFAQQIAHHSINGCIMQSGDLLASGTISGDEPDSFGSMLELTWNGSKPITLHDGSTRAFINDGDTLVLRGRTTKGPRIGFGECRATVLPAKSWPK